MKLNAPSLIGAFALITVLTIVGLIYTGTINLRLSAQCGDELEACNREDIDKVLWWKKTNFYHIYIRSFKDSNGDGEGDLQGIINTLDYLKHIGIETLLLSPFYSSPMKDGGYDIDNFKDTYKKFGTLDDVKMLFDEAHKRNMYVVIDFVPNHSSNKHPWFVCSERALIDPNCFKYKDYYVWSNSTRYLDTQTGQHYPSNWKSLFYDLPAWTYSEIRKEFYLHQFLVEQPDLNFRNPLVREEFRDIERFWLRMGADGLRVDAVLHLIEDDFLRDEPVNPAWREFDSTSSIYESYIHIYTRLMYASSQIVHDWHAVAQEPEFASRPRLVLSEAYASITKTIEFYGPSPYWRSSDMPFNFELFRLNYLNIYEPRVVAKVINRWLSNVRHLHWPRMHGARDPWTCWVLGNHDNIRLVNRVGYKNSLALQWIAYLTLGSPVSYYGDELGADNIDATKVPQATLLEGEPTRFASRGLMPWTGTSQNAGFSSNQSTWLPPSNNYVTNNVETQLNELKSNSNSKNELANFIHLTSIRQKYIKTVVFGETLFYAAEPLEKSSIFAMGRVHPVHENLLVLVNFHPSLRQQVKLLQATKLADISFNPPLIDSLAGVKINLNLTDDSASNNILRHLSSNDKIPQSPPKFGKIIAINFDTLPQQANENTNNTEQASNNQSSNSNILEVGKTIELDKIELAANQGVIIEFKLTRDNQ